MPDNYAGGQMRASVVIAAFIAFTSSVTNAQGQAARESPSFAVASVKPNKAAPGSPQRVNITPERVSIINETARTLISVAYPGLEIDGAPDWVGRSGSPAGDRFDVEAKPAVASPRADLEAMLRSLLADRYKLKAHLEPRPQETYALVIARADGKLGDRLRPAEADCRSLMAKAEPTGARDVCGLGNAGLAATTGTLSVRGLTLDQLAGFINRDVRRRVVNKTGLAGVFDWTLTWTPQALARPDLDRNRFPTIDPNGPTIFTALQEQLGLKLTPSTENVNVLVIDHVERPSEN
jgi:uncharacterized protein (TIGR03435 family)